VNFLGIGGLEFVLIFAVALFVVGPKRLAEGVRASRKYITELRRYRNELRAMVSEAIDAEGIKEDMRKAGVTQELEAVKRDLTIDPDAVQKDLDESGVTAQLTGLRKDLTLDQGNDEGAPAVPAKARARASSSKAHFADRGNGKISGQSIPSLDLSGGAEAARETDDRGQQA
jgi:Tat protein translocase TatB subunit